MQWFNCLISTQQFVELIVRDLDEELQGLENVHVVIKAIADLKDLDLFSS
jgi:hypothetical protein